ncbi:MAG: response regulator [Deferrisomatales bacterium]|nr:response regulator [Deferrisomatales bacterium]
MTRHTLLLVDDEENLLRALARLFRRLGHQILSARDGAEALLVLKEHPVSVIISDHRMPGMSGAELLRAAAQVQPEAVRVMLTGYGDLQAATSAINESRVYRFLPKPWEDAELLRTVEEALADLDLKREHRALRERVARQSWQLRDLNEDLERKVRERTEALQDALDHADLLNRNLRQQNLATVKAFAGLLDLRHPELGAHCRRVAGLVEPVCSRLGVTDADRVQEVVIGALLHDLGRLALPDAILLQDAAHLGDGERETVMRHPVLGQGQVQVIEGLTDVALMLRHHHENMDGSGYPDGLAGDQIPWGARVIRVLDAYDHGTPKDGRQGCRDAAAPDAMDRQVGRHFDGEVFHALRDVLRRRDEAGEGSPP